MVATAATFDQAIDWRDIFSPLHRFLAFLRRVVMPAGLTDDDKDGLSEEELAAIEDEDSETSDGDDGSEPPPGDDDGPPPEDGGDKDDKDGGDSGADDKDGDDEPSGDKDGKGAADDDGESTHGDGDDTDDGGQVDDGEKETSSRDDIIQQPIVPTLPGVDPSELQQAEDAYKEARKKFEDGEIDYVEYEEVKDRYNRLKWKAEDSQELNTAVRETLWQQEQKRFYDDNPMFIENPVVNRAFVAEVNRLLAEINQAVESGDTSNEMVTWDDRTLLNKAKENLEPGLRELIGDRKERRDKHETRREAAREKTKRDLANNPKDLAGIPEADDNNDDDEFAWLDKLEGEAFEKALEKLTPAQLERYEDR